MRPLILFAALLSAGAAQAEVHAPVPQPMSMEQAVALALSRNHEVIAAKLNIDAALLDRVQAGVYWNPTLSYSLNNLVVGSYNPQGDPPIPSPGFFGQSQHTIAISEVIDIWAKRSTRMNNADRSVELSKLRVEDALRDIVHEVRSAFADVLRERLERDLARETRVRYDETVRLSRARFAGGDISQADLKKIELEGMRYQLAEIDAEMELDLSLQKLAALLAYGSPAQLPGIPVGRNTTQVPIALEPVLEQALRDRPDVRAAKQAKLVSEAALEQARREALPDVSLSLSYTHSYFQASGDNPNTLGFGLSLPVPLFDRNQANIGRAKLDGRRADNEAQRLLVQVRSEVASAVRRTQRGAQLLTIYDGGMLERADTSLRVAEKSYRAGAISLLELLEAQRTYLETRAQYVRALYEYHQAIIDVMHAKNGEVK